MVGVLLPPVVKIPSFSKFSFNHTINKKVADSVIQLKTNILSHNNKLLFITYTNRALDYTYQRRQIRTAV